MKKFLLLTALLLATGFLYAEDYNALAQRIRQEVWKWDLPEFQQRDIPEQFQKESSIILAAHSRVTISLRSPLNLWLTKDRKQSCQNTYRMLVKINDKNAVDEYSQFEYNTQWKDVSITQRTEVQRILGIRIIKPDGSMKEIESDAYKTTDGPQERQRIAIPGLETGDILDIFWMDNIELKNRQMDPLYFTFATNKPMLSYTIHCELNKNLVSEYRSLNGAPQFTASTTPEGDFILDASSTGPVGKEPIGWYVTMRQTPIISLQIFNPSLPLTTPSKYARAKGLHKDVPLRVIEQEAASRFLEFTPLLITANASVIKLMKNYLTNHPNRTEKEKADYLFQALYFEWWHNDEDCTPDKFIIALHHLFKKHKINCEVGMTTRIEMEELDQLTRASNLTFALRLDDGTCYFYPDSYPVPGEIPASVNGQPIDWIPAGDLKANLEKPFLREYLPADKAQEITNSFSVHASFSSEIPNALDIERKCTYVKSYSKTLMQELLVCYQDYDNAMRHILETPKKLLEETNAKERAVLSASLEQERKEEIYRYQNEAYIYHETQPHRVSQYTMEQIGIGNRCPDLKYQLTYILPDCVKKAGSNYLVSIGKLIGRNGHIEPSMRTDNHEQILYQARTTQWEIYMDIPEGFETDPESISRLQRTIENEAGTFRSQASLDEKQIKLSLIRSIKERTLPADKLPQLLEIMDAVSAFGRQTVFLRQKASE